MEIHSMSESPEKLVGPEAIRTFFGWSLDKYYRKRAELEKACVIYYEWQGRPPKRVACMMKTLALKWLILKAEKKETI